MKKVQNGSVFHRTWARDHLCHLRDFLRDEDRHVREEQPDEVKTIGFMLPELVPVDVAQLQHVLCSKPYQLMRPVCVVLHHVGKRSGFDGLGVGGLEVVTLQIAVISHFPVGPMNDAMTHIGPLVHALLRHIVHHGTEVGANINIALGIQHRENQSALFVAGELHQIPGTLAHVAKLRRIGNGTQCAVGLEGPAMVRAAEQLLIAAGF